MRFLGCDAYHSPVIHILFHPDYTVGLGFAPNLLTLI
jgi:hypothetical protein